MESEVITALVGAPAVLITAVAAWLAGRAQSRGAYQGPVDAVRRAAQREAYADLYRAGHEFNDTWRAAEAAHLNCVGTPGNEVPFSPEVHELLNQMHETQRALVHAADMVRLEGPESLAQIADQIHSGARQLGGIDLGPLFGRNSRSTPLMLGYITSPEMDQARTKARSQFSRAHRELLSAARQYLNGKATT